MGGLRTLLNAFDDMSVKHFMRMHDNNSMRVTVLLEFSILGSTENCSDDFFFWVK